MMGNINLEKLKKLHVEQDFDAPVSRAPEYVFGASNLFPNELVYLVECRTGRVEPINKLADKVFKKKGVRFKEIEDLYDVVGSTHLDPFFDRSLNLIELATSGQLDIDPAIPYRDTTYTVYRSVTGRMILRRGTIVSINANGAMEYTVGFLSDVTDIHPGKMFSFKTEGPNKEIIYAHQNKLSEFVNPLSCREMEILNLIGKGYKSKEISAMLYISTHTVNKHRLNILRKLEENTAISAYNKAVDMGVLKY